MVETQEFTVELSAKECFKAFFGDEDKNFYHHFKEVYQGAKDLKFNKYDQRIPSFYADELSTDVESIL